MARRTRINPRAERNIRRASYRKDVKQSFLIICEGSNTEPDYFNAFRLTSAIVKTIGEGCNTLTLVQRAISIRDAEFRKGNKYDQFWVVFDKDDFPNDDFNGAIKIAEASGMHVAYSNQAIELWFLLHFSLIQGAMHRCLYDAKLSALIGIPYSKEQGFAADLYRMLLNRQETAIKNAKTIMKLMEGVSPALAESSTTIYRLVEELNKYLCLSLKKVDTL